MKTYGSNVIPRGKGDTALDLIWRQINNPLIWVLLVSAVVAMAVDPTGGIKNGLVILALVVLNTVIGCVLPTNLGLALILMWAVAFFPFVEATHVIAGAAQTVRELLLPMTPAQLLWINLVAAVALALPLAFEAKEPNIKNRPPRDPGAPVLSGFIVMRTFVVAILMTAGAIGLFLYEFETAGAQAPQALAKAQTMAVTTVIMFQIFYLLNCRSLRDSIWKIGVFSNKTVFIGIAAILALQALFIFAPFMHAIFASAPLALGDVLVSILVGAVILPVVGLEKWWHKRRTVKQGYANNMQENQQ